MGRVVNDRGFEDMVLGTFSHQRGAPALTSRSEFTAVVGDPWNALAEPSNHAKLESGM